VVFALAGYKIDTSFRIFMTEFQVHSVILKLHSKFFRAFLDSADIVAAPSNATFLYQYDTVVDDDGQTWGLEALQKVGLKIFSFSLRSKLTLSDQGKR
jgi:hypothetical protein